MHNRVSVFFDVWAGKFSFSFASSPADRGYLMRTNMSGLGAAAVLAVGAATAWGQFYVEQGHVQDANARLGSGGLNRPVNVYDFRAGNRLVTGNVTAGRSFRGYSPVRDPSQLFLSRTLGRSTADLAGVPSELAGTTLRGLGSTRLSDFQRDSASVGEIVYGQSRFGQPRPFYHSSSTVANTGAISSGLNRPGTSQLHSLYMLPSTELRPLSAGPALPDRSGRSGTLLKTETQLMRINTGEPITGPVNRRLAGSSLFSHVRAVPVNALAARAERDAALGAAVGGPVDLRISGTEPIDTRVDLAVPEVGGVALMRPTGSPLDQVLVPAGEGAWPANGSLGEVLGSVVVGGRPPRQMAGSLTDAADVFASMRAASAQTVRPLTPEVEGADAGVTTPDVSIRPRVDSKREVMAKPVRTFVGRRESAVNEYLAKGEALLKSGDYYKAANQYDLARVVDPRNPLPPLGRSMALLAAGDYMTSANNLFLAISLFESLANFQIDLAAFIPPDLNVLDRRRAYLENRLEVFDDFRLRFLLGFAEYCSGIEGGLANLEKAAAAAPEQLKSLREFVKILKQRAGESAEKPAADGEKEQ